MTDRAGPGRGLFIAFEGIEGSGKTTQARRLVQWLDGRRLPYLALREPGGTAAGEAIRTVLLEGGELSARAELLLMLAARAALLEQRVRPALAAGQIVVADRYELSTLAYQGYGRGLPLDEVRRLNAFATDGLSADLTLVLAVPPAEGSARRRRERRDEDRIERAGPAFHARVAEAYGLLAGGEPGIERLDGTGPPDRVGARVLSVLAARFPETFQPTAG